MNRYSEMTLVSQNWTNLLNRELSNNDQFRIFTNNDENVEFNCQYYVVSVKSNLNKFVDEMFKNGIHLMKEDVWDCSEYDFSKDNEESFFIAKEFNPTLVRIPNSSFLTEKEILKITSIMNNL